MRRFESTAELLSACAEPVVPAVAAAVVVAVFSVVLFVVVDLRCAVDAVGVGLAWGTGGGGWSKVAAGGDNLVEGDAAAAAGCGADKAVLDAG